MEKVSSFVVLYGHRLTWLNQLEQLHGLLASVVESAPAFSDLGAYDEAIEQCERDMRKAGELLDWLETMPMLEQVEADIKTHSDAIHERGMRMLNRIMPRRASDD